MSVIWFKIWYDLWHNKLRTLLVVVSIAVGVFSVGATFGMAEQMLPAMDAAHKSTAPSHVQMALLQPLDPSQVIALEKVPGVETVEASNIVEVRYKLTPEDKWHKGNVLMRQDYDLQVYDLLQLRSGSWPKGKSLSIERMHSPFYGIDIGDQVILEVGDQERTFPITGKIRHPFVPPPSMYDMAWFFGGEDVIELFGIPRGTYMRISFRVEDYTPENARRVASEVKDRLGRQGVGVAATLYQDPDKHWGRVFVDGMSVVMQVLAVISMLLSAVLVSNTLMAIITQQTNQLGILKAIGGSSFMIARIYLTGVFAYGLLALCIALPLGALTSFRLSSWFLSVYNIDYEQFAVSRQAIIYEAIAALAVPLLAALFPILNGAAITVRQAIASYGLGGDFGSSWIDRLVEGIGRRFLISYNAMALANIFRRKGRLVLTQMVLVIAGVMYLMVMSLNSSIKATLDAEFGRRTHDIIVLLEDFQRVDRTVAQVESVPGVEHADMWLAAPATILQQGQKSLDAGLGSQLQGVPVDDPMYKPSVVEGRWFQPGDGRVIVMNKKTADDEGIRLGDVVTLDLGHLGDDEWEVIGLYRVFVMFGGGFSVDAIFAPREAVFAATKKTGRANTLLVRTQSHAGADVETCASRLTDLFSQRNIEVMQTETMPVLRQTSDITFSYVVIMLLMLAVIVALVGGIGLMGALWISVIERTKEIGVMRAIGALSPTIMGMFMLEGIVQGLLSWLIALPLSMLVAPLMANALGQALFNSRLDYSFNIGAVFTWLAVILVVAAVASLIPARNATRINVRQSLTYE
jgi:putative ABC transport system permease protein